MANSKRKCVNCKERFPAEEMRQYPVGWMHSTECAIEYANRAGKKIREKQLSKARREDREKEKAQRAQHRADKEKIRKRTGKNGYYESLKRALHHYVKHVLRKGEPCYTCGKPQSPNDAGGAFHVGHFIPAKEVDPRRFMLENLRIQCYSCNAMNSGRRVEYRQAMIEEMGLSHVEWLEAEANHQSLKDKYPTVEDIKKEAAYYRRLSRQSE